MKNDFENEIIFDKEFLEQMDYLKNEPYTALIKEKPLNLNMIIYQYLKFKIDLNDKENIRNLMLNFKYREKNLSAFKSEL
jgi:hypothetical protein